MHDFLSLRSWIVFICAESILAGFLLMLDALNGPLMILLGLGGLVLLWAHEHRPTWVQQCIVRWWPKPSMSMDEAVHLLMDRVGYEALTGPAFTAFHREGRIRAFGRPILSGWDPSSGYKLGAEVEIPAEYWENAKPQWTSHIKTSKTRHLAKGLEYGEVRFVRDDVMGCYFGGAPPMSSEGPV